MLGQENEVKFCEWKLEKTSTTCFSNYQILYFKYEVEIMGEFDEQTLNGVWNNLQIL